MSANICSSWRPSWRGQRFPYCACALQYQYQCESQNDTLTRSFQWGFYSERRQEQEKSENEWKIHYVEIFGIFEISFFIFIASLYIVELFLKLLSLGNWILQRLFLRSFLPSFTDLQIIRRESTNLSSHLTYLNRSQTWRIIYQNKGKFSLHSNLAIKLRFQHACAKELRPIIER